MADDLVDSAMLRRDNPAPPSPWTRAKAGNARNWQEEVRQPPVIGERAGISKYVPVDKATLRQSYIENEHAKPWLRIKKGDVDNRCSDWCGEYRDIFKTAQIEHVRLSSGRHTFLAVRTEDEGILIFDPSFKQYYPEFGGDYFLGKPEAFVRFIQEHGGWGREWEDVRGPINAWGSFTHRGIDLPLGANAAIWHAALSPIPAQRLGRNGDDEPVKKGAVREV